MLSASKRREIAAKAARVLRSRSVRWTKGYWIRSGATENVHISSDSSLGHVRERLRKHGLWGRNNECSVCLEGALLYALAEDPEIPDDAYGEELLGWFSDDARAALGYETDEWEGIINLNDSDDYSKEDALALLDRMASA